MDSISLSLCPQSLDLRVGGDAKGSPQRGELLFQEAGSLLDLSPMEAAGQVLPHSRSLLDQDI